MIYIYKSNDLLFCIKYVANLQLHESNVKEELMFK